MPDYAATREIDIPVPASVIFTVLTDYAQLPEWQSRIRACRVLDRDAEGRGTEVEYEIDAVVRTVRYRVRHLYRDHTWIGSEYLGGDFRNFGGEYRLEARDGCTHVTFTLTIDPGLTVPGPLARTLNQTVMGRSLEDLRRHAMAVHRGETPTE